MGEVAEMMIDGTLCEGCGCVMPGEAPGYPRKCYDCRKDEGAAAPGAKINCPVCRKYVKVAGLKDHMRDRHGIVPAAPRAKPEPDERTALIEALQSLVRYDSYETEYDGRMMTICPDCGRQDGEHDASCEFVKAKALLAKVAAIAGTGDAP